MADVYDYRLRNLRRLRGPERGGHRRLAEKLGMSESQLSQIIGKNPTKRIGDDVARAAEKRLKLPQGWLDSEYPGLSPETVELARKIQALDPDTRSAIVTLLNRPK